MFFEAETSSSFYGFDVP